MFPTQLQTWAEHFSSNQNFLESLVQELADKIKVSNSAKVSTSNFQVSKVINGPATIPEVLPASPTHRPSSNDSGFFGSRSKTGQSTLEIPTSTPASKIQGSGGSRGSKYDYRPLEKKARSRSPTIRTPSHSRHQDQEINVKKEPRRSDTSPSRFASSSRPHDQFSARHDKPRHFEQNKQERNVSSYKCFRCMTPGHMFMNCPHVDAVCGKCKATGHVAQVHTVDHYDTRVRIMNVLGSENFHDWLSSNKNQ